MKPLVERLRAAAQQAEDLPWGAAGYLPLALCALIEHAEELECSVELETLLRPVEAEMLRLIDALGERRRGQQPVPMEEKVRRARLVGIIDAMTEAGARRAVVVGLRKSKAGKTNAAAAYIVDEYACCVPQNDPFRTDMKMRAREVIAREARVGGRLLAKLVEIAAA